MSVTTKFLDKEMKLINFAFESGVKAVQEPVMSKIPPSEWPKYNSTSECSGCGKIETIDHHSQCSESGLSVRLVGEYIYRVCGCGAFRFERPLDFDFDAWKAVWAAEKVLVEARKALGGYPSGPCTCELDKPKKGKCK